MTKAKRGSLPAQGWAQYFTKDGVEYMRDAQDNLWRLVAGDEKAAVEAKLYDD